MRLWASIALLSLSFQHTLPPGSLLDLQASGSLAEPAPWPYQVWGPLPSQLSLLPNLGLSPLPCVSVSSLFIFVLWALTLSLCFSLHLCPSLYICLAP